MKTMTPHCGGRGRIVLPLVAGLALALAAGCSTPLPEDGERSLRRSVIDATLRELRQAELAPELRTLEAEPGVERLGINPQLIPELEAMAGAPSYADERLPMNEDLLGLTQGAVAITLEKAIRSAVENNLEVQFARIAPAISTAQITQAEAAFDWVLFANAEYADIDEPRTTTSPLLREAREERDTTTLNFGVRRRFATGMQLTAQQEFVRNDVDAASPPHPNHANASNLTLRLDQPLLEGFGPDVNLAQVRLAQNAERDAVAGLKRELIRIATQTEQTYWELTRAYQDLLILQRLLERGIEVRGRVEARVDLDATPAQVADARARVERRRADVLRAQNILRDVSDRLKALINDPELTVGSEVLLLPVDRGVAAPVSFSVLDALVGAIRNRPEVQQALLSLDNTSIRQLVANNQRLPQLDLRFQTRFSGLDENLGGAFEEEAETDHVNYLIGLSFEQPIGNRAAEALFRQRQLERMQATVAYRNTIQQVLLEVKRALRSVVTSYRLIEQTRITRYAEAENLRSFLVEIENLRGFSVDLLDLQFRRQEALAQAERDEAAAIADYNTALANLAAATGTALERSGIEFVVSDAFEPVVLNGFPPSAPPPAAEPPRVIPPAEPDAEPIQE